VRKLRKIGQELLDGLPELAKIVIGDRPENSNFKQNPDDPEEHDPRWHQFGIITHTKKFSEFYQTKAQECLRQVGVDKNISKQLSRQIDGITKTELLQISIPLHDIGKFARDFKEEKGKGKPNYKGHWEKSERLIVENEQIRSFLRKTYGLTNSQVLYIARCAGLHYELGKVRETAERSHSGYTIAFVESEECKEACIEIARKFPDFKEEIGILFLCDSLAKTDVEIEVETDQDIENQTEQIKQVIEERRLNPKLIAAAKERPVNIAIAKRYLELVNKE